MANGIQIRIRDPTMDQDFCNPALQPLLKLSLWYTFNLHTGFIAHSNRKIIIKILSILYGTALQRLPVSCDYAHMLFNWPDTNTLLELWSPLESCREERTLQIKIIIRPGLKELIKGTVQRDGSAAPQSCLIKKLFIKGRGAEIIFPAPHSERAL